MLSIGLRNQFKLKRNSSNANNSLTPIEDMITPNSMNNNKRSNKRKKNNDNKIDVNDQYSSKEYSSLRRALMESEEADK